MRKIIALTVGFLLLFSVVTAFAADQITITAWGWSGLSEQFEAMPDFQKKYPNIKIKSVEYGPEECKQKFLISLMAGIGAPDITFMDRPKVGPYLAFGGLVDLTDKVSGLKNDFSVADWDSYVYKGRIYALPMDSGPGGLWYRKDIFDEAGIDADSIETWDEYVSEGKKVVKDFDGDGKTDRYLLAVRADLPTEVEIFGMMLQSKGGSLNKPDDIVAADTIETMKWWTDLVVKDKVAVFTRFWRGEHAEMMKTGRIASQAYPAFFVLLLKGPAYSPEQEGKWRAKRFLAWEKGKPTGGGFGGCGPMIPKQSKYADIALDIIKTRCATVKSQVWANSEKGMFPPYLPAQKALSDITTSLFGEQRFNVPFIESIPDTPSWNYGMNFPIIMDCVGKAMDRIILEGAPIEEALTDAAEEARKLISLKG